MKVGEFAIVWLRRNYLPPVATVVEVVEVRKKIPYFYAKPVHKVDAHRHRRRLRFHKGKLIGVMHRNTTMKGARKLMEEVSLLQRAADIAIADRQDRLAASIEALL